MEGSATLHGTGIAPGGISEKFPLLFSAILDGRDIRSRRGVLGPAHL